MNFVYHYSIKNLFNKAMYHLARISLFQSFLEFKVIEIFEISFEIYVPLHKVVTFAKLNFTFYFL